MHKDEIALKNRIKDTIAHVEKTGQIKKLDFYNENNLTIISNIAKKHPEVIVTMTGGFTPSVRKRVIITPNYIKNTNEDVLIMTILPISNTTFTHSQVLGSLMSLNIDRCVIGDIVVNEGGTFVAIKPEFETFLKENFTRIGRHEITLSNADEAVANHQQFETFDIVVSSMRVDVIVKALINASRMKASEYLLSDFVRLNGHVEKKSSKVCQIGDVLSIRRAGRFTLHEFKKATKNGKSVIQVKKST